VRNLLAILAVLVIAALTGGWARNWYTVKMVEAEPGKTAFRVEIDRTKVSSDFVEAARYVQRTLRTEDKDAKKAE